MTAAVELHRAGRLGAPAVTVRQWLAQWLSEGDWKDTTRERYGDVVRLHIAPAIGSLELAALGREDIEAMLTGLRGLSPATRLKVQRVVHRAINVAVYRGLLPVNVVALVEAPRAIRHRPTLWTTGELARFWAALPADHFGALWALLIGTGCRLGEALAMDWTDYDASTRAVVINKTLSETRTPHYEPLRITA